jgi:F420-0:gamma-glutamyl ligase-like protein
MLWLWLKVIIGFLFGALLIMACITVANMRRGVLLHKLILLEVRHDDALGHTM